MSINMTVKDFLEIMDTSNITTFKVNGEEESLIVIKNLYLDEIIVDAVVTAKLDDLTKEDVQFIYHLENEEDLSEVVQIEPVLPSGASYINITLNIITKEC